ncbi:30S ribosomal protein S20 [candidate division KSB1 bacterium]|nr:MAG: 30S ribosomal protein S20 [candidate division KSB1 bacterium]
MPKTKSAYKRLRKSLKQKQRNRQYKSTLKTAIKKLCSLTDRTEAEQELRKTISLIDKLASKGIIHKNKASNKKSKLTRLVNSL